MWVRLFIYAVNFKETADHVSNLNRVEASRYIRRQITRLMNTTIVAITNVAASSM